VSCERLFDCQAKKSLVCKLVGLSFLIHQQNGEKKPEVFFFFSPFFQFPEGGGVFWEGLRVSEFNSCIIGQTCNIIGLKGAE
jgi:hypothetical protein